MAVCKWVCTLSVYESLNKGLEGLRSSCLTLRHGYPAFSHAGGTRLSKKQLYIVSKGPDMTTIPLMALCRSFSVAFITSISTLKRVSSCPKNTPREFMVPLICLAIWKRKEGQLLVVFKGSLRKKQLTILNVSACPFLASKSSGIWLAMETAKALTFWSPLPIGLCRWEWRTAKHQRTLHHYLPSFLIYIDEKAYLLHSRHFLHLFPWGWWYQADCWSPFAER